MRRLFLTVLMLLSAFARGFGETRTIRMAVHPVEPYMMADPATGGAAGASVDYWVEYIAPRLGYTVELVGVFPIIRLMAMLEKGEIDVAPLFTKTPDREARFLFPETHSADVMGCLMVLPESPIIEVKRREDLFGKRIAYLEGAFLPPLLDHPAITIELVSSVDFRRINLNKLLYGRVDAWFEINHVSTLYYLKKNGLLDMVRVIPLPTETTHIYSIFRKTPEGERLRDEYDRVNREGVRDSVFERILNRYLE